MRPALLRLAMRYTEDTDEAEDVIQKVMSFWAQVQNDILFYLLSLRIEN